MCNVVKGHQNPENECKVKTNRLKYKKIARFFLSFSTLFLVYDMIFFVFEHEERKKQVTND